MHTHQTLTFATANLFNFVAPPNAFYDFENIYETQAWAEKCRWTKEKLTLLDADIVGLQEVFSIEAARQMMADLGYGYFAVVDTPHIEQEYIYSQPVVAVASRYPITRYEAVMPPSALMESYDVPFPDFSRQPISAVVSVPNIGEIAVYVCHLKSQRATESASGESEHPLLGRWLSHQQRGWEAVMLRIAMENAYRSHPVPTVLMGDMNQSLDSVLTGQLTLNTSSGSATLTLEDSWSLYQTNDKAKDRAATHYHFATGNVLDYLLLSQEFQAHSPYSLADVVGYQVLDQHLINPSFAQDSQASDHAFVSVTVSFVL